MLLVSILLFFTNCIEPSAPDNFCESSFLELSDSASVSGSKPNEKIRASFHKISEEVLYFGAGVILGSASLWARLGWEICLIFPWSSTVGNECLLLSHLCGSAAQHAFVQIFKRSSSPPHPVFRGVSSSQHSWYLNKMLLSQIPAFSDKERQLLLFLEKHWLAKSTGFFPSVIDWVCPCFRVRVQVHPETSSTYARNPWNAFSQTYKNRVEIWKRALPHPYYFPLILTRPFDLQNYLPSYFDVPKDEKIQTTVERIAFRMQTAGSKAVVDLTHVLPQDIKNQEEWVQSWQIYQNQFLQTCKAYNLNPDQILCIQRARQGEVGGIRLLPFANQEIDQNHQFLLEWISHLGLSANRIELDRPPPFSSSPILGSKARSAILSEAVPIKLQSREEYISYLNSYEKNWQSAHLQKTLMLKGTLQVLKGLLATLSEDKWNEIMHCPTRSLIAQLSFFKIQEQLKRIAQEKDEVLFFDMVAHIEEIHADLSSLLEIFAPFTPDDFPDIYRDLLTTIPLKLKPLTSCAVHTSGMTSLAGIFKAVEKTLGAPPCVLYGENTYFECIGVAKLFGKASSIEEATEEDWKQVDLLFAQFNPALKRIDLQATEYKMEKIAEILHKSLNARAGKPLTLALDCTLDFIDSPRVARLLNEFQDAIEAGTLNIICYRSGLKFDLFGMDNYCGAPLYMIHNQGAQWTAFELLLTDPVLQTDQLSLNWFCLAYQSASLQLELYRRQIFDNTRALLNKVPSRLFDKNRNYRIVPVEQGADPAFIDIKISGPLHQIRGAALVGGSLYMRCMEGGHPIFYRPSLGFYHPNFTMIFSEENTTIRLTLGLDPAQVDLLAETFEIVDSLNGASWKILPDKMLQNLFLSLERPHK